MINRRTLLFGTAGIALTSVLTGCQRAAQKAALKVLLLEGAVPSEVLQKFQQQAAEAVRFQAATQISDIFQQLQSWQKLPEASEASKDSIRRFLPWLQAEAEPKRDDLVSIGDYWLESAITQNLIEPLNIPASSLEKLPIGWQRFSSRDSQGLVEGLSEPSASEPAAQKISLWAAPYRVQSLAIVYRKNLFSETLDKTLDDSSAFTSWQALLQPSLSGSIALPDHPRLVIGLAHKIQSGSFNTVIEGPDSGAGSSTTGMNNQVVATLNQLNQHRLKPTAQ